MKISKNKILLVLLCLSILVLSFLKEVFQSKTQGYINNVDLKAFEYSGSSFTSPKFSPFRVKKDFEQIDIEYDYDFGRLSHTEKKLEGVSRKKVLKHLFSKITLGRKTDTEKHIAVLEFLHRASLHNPILQPMYPDKSMVSDPLVLLELSEMRCGHVASLAVDLFEAGGYKGRLVQLGGHIIAEIYYGQKWHYIDADIFGGSQTILDNDGFIPSIAFLSNDRWDYIDSLGFGRELNYNGAPSSQSLLYPSYYYFNKKAFGTSTALYYFKRGFSIQKLKEKLKYFFTSSGKYDRYYGWNNYNIKTANDIELNNFGPYYQPTAPEINDISITDEYVQIKFDHSIDKDNDLVGYKIFVSKNSRNWSYSKFLGSERAKKFWSNPQGYEPEMYSELFRLPPHEIELILTQDNKAQFKVEKGSTIFVSIMPYDQHGQSVGKVLYPMSNEVKITLN